MQSVRFTGIIFVMTTCIGLLLSTYVWAHSFHISSAELEYNTQSGHFEVAVKLNSIDLQQLLVALNSRKPEAIQANNEPHAETVINERPIDISPEDQRRLESYFREHFFLSRGDNQADQAVRKSDIVWAGTEVEATAVWCYFELKPPAGDGQLTLTNTVLMNLHKGQTNTAVLISNTGRASFKTSENNFQVALPPCR